MNRQDKELLQEFFKTLTTPGMYVTSPKYRQRLSHNDPQDATYLRARSVSLVKLLSPVNKSFANIAEMIGKETYIKVANAPGHKDGTLLIDRYHDVSPPPMADYHWAEGEKVDIFSIVEICNELGIDFPE